jgi:hypothetical protein
LWDIVSDEQGVIVRSACQVDGHFVAQCSRDGATDALQNSGDIVYNVPLSTDNQDPVRFNHDWLNMAG